MCTHLIDPYSYDKSQQDALFLKFILIKNSTCLRQIYCPSSGVSTLYTHQQVFVTVRGSVRSTLGLGPTTTARGLSVGISIGMLPQTLIMSITVQKTSKYYTTEFDLEEGF